MAPLTWLCHNVHPIYKIYRHVIAALLCYGGYFYTSGSNLPGNGGSVMKQIFLVPTAWRQVGFFSEGLSNHTKTRNHGDHHKYYSIITTSTVNDAVAITLITVKIPKSVQTHHSLIKHGGRHSRDT